VYQHKVEPFELVDKTKSGRRTIVAFFLCDPSYQVYSSSKVPPQNVDWLKAILFAGSITKSSLLDLPWEIKERIVNILVEDGSLLDRGGAEAARAELMEERSNFVRVQDENNFEAEYK